MRLVTTKATTVSRVEANRKGSGDADGHPWVVHQRQCHGPQIIWSERLRKERVGTTAIGSLTGLLLGVGGQHEDFEISRSSVTPDPLQHFPAVHPRQPNIENEQ